MSVTAPAIISRLGILKLITSKITPIMVTETADMLPIANPLKIIFPPIIVIHE